MAFSKVTLNGVTLMDLTSDTATAASVRSGYTAHDASGTQVTGTYTGSGGNYQSKSFTPDETGATITPDSGYDALSQVTVAAISSTYVGTGVDRRSSSDLTASGATVTAPAGYYAEAATKSVATGTATAPTTISATGATVSTTSNTLTLSKNVSVTPRITTAGYISSGTAGTSSVTMSATVAIKGSATITPGTSNQTISSGTYLTGTQTISGDANLTAGNIKKDVSIFGVTGTYEGGGGSMNFQCANGVNRVATTGYTAVSGQSLTVAATGTYNVYWSGYRSSTGGTNGSQLYIDETAYGSAQTTFSNNGQSVKLTGVSLTKNQTVAVYARARGTNYYMYVANLTIEQTA